MLNIERLPSHDRRLVVLALTPDDLWFRRCCGKIKHTDYGAAAAEAARLSLATGERMAAYFCEDGCGFYHCGSVK